MRRPLSPALSRRGFLRGTGAVIALPFMESLFSKAASAQTAGAPIRFFGFYCPCGMRMDTWTPSDTGRGFTLPPSLEPLAPVRDDILVLSGLSNDPRGDHTAGTGTFLTAKTPEVGTIRNGISLDQVIADLHGHQTHLRSIELACEQVDRGGTCDMGLSCAYQQSISWAAPDRPNAAELNPRAAFDRLFGSDALLTPEERAVRQKHDLSVLDFVTGEVQRLKPRLGARDKRKLDQYLTGVRELEVRIETREENDRCGGLVRPDGATTDHDEYARQMIDLVALAFQCDVTRVGTMMLAKSGTGRAYPHLGLSSSHHELSHHQLRPDKLEGLLAINRWEVDLFSSLLQQLAEMEEEGPNGEPVSILHNTIAVMGSELADGDRHNADDMPVLVGGRGGGFLDSGRHVVLPAETPIANLYYTLATNAGAQMAVFGEDGTEILPQLLV